LTALSGSINVSDGMGSELFNAPYMRGREHKSVRTTEGDAIASVAHVLNAIETENVARKRSMLRAGSVIHVATARGSIGQLCDFSAVKVALH
jgi:hypothetical protein